MFFCFTVYLERYFECVYGNQYELQVLRERLNFNHIFVFKRLKFYTD